MSSRRTSVAGTAVGVVPAVEAFRRAFHVDPVGTRPWRSATLNV